MYNKTYINYIIILTLRQIRNY